ncbi:MAG: transglutaminase family protein [Thermoleophilia bacterium]
MLRLLAKHRTEMHYAGEARDSINEIRLCPRSNGRQRVELCHVEVEPHVGVHHHLDAFGNDVAWFQIDQPHTELVVETTAVVLVTPHPPHPDTVPWEALRAPEVRDGFAEFLSESELVHWPHSVDYFAQGLELDGIEDVARWLRALERAVNDNIRYERGSTGVDTTVEHLLQVRRGVCQDMAHLFLALCRRKGVPARYVSGWLFQPGRDEPGESHAWCDAWVPGAGWMEFDPTHPEPNMDHYIRIGVGRDYMDVPPFRGTYVGAATERMAVHVTVEELPLSDAA